MRHRKTPIPTTTSTCSSVSRRRCSIRASNEPLVIGLSVGSTPYSVAPRQSTHIRILTPSRSAADSLRTSRGRSGRPKARPSQRRSSTHPRLHLHEGDGRDWMLDTEDRVRRHRRRCPTPAIRVQRQPPLDRVLRAGLSDHLADGGLFAEWVPTERVLASVAEVFPHVATAVGPGPAEFLIASNDPIPADRGHALARFRARPHGALSPEQRSVARAFLRAR